MKLAEDENEENKEPDPHEVIQQMIKLQEHCAYQAKFFNQSSRFLKIAIENAARLIEVDELAREQALSALPELNKSLEAADAESPFEKPIQPEEKVVLKESEAQQNMLYLYKDGGVFKHIY